MKIGGKCKLHAIYVHVENGCFMRLCPVHWIKAPFKTH